jgi:DNA-binding response OmpR family regulator
VTPSARILLVDEDAVFRGVIATLLEREGHSVEAVASAESALSRVQQEEPDVVILDIDMPEMGGLELLTRIRSSSTVPVMIVSARGAETERVLGLDLGADDYVVKPFLPRELAARLRALLRRTAEADPAAAHRFGPLEIRVATRQVLVDERPIPLTPREFDLLVYLAERPRVVVSRQQLLSDVWKSSAEWQDAATVTEHVRRLRHKIEADPAHPRWIRAVRAVGYCFEPG